MWTYLWIFWSAWLVFANGAQAAEVVSDRYQDAVVYFAREGSQGFADVADFNNAVNSLATQFSRICGDTFCSGSYHNLTPLDFSCSIDTANARIGECLWVFSGSYTKIDPATGAVSGHTRSFRCNLGVGGAPADLTNFMRLASSEGSSGYDGLIGPKIPGTDLTLYDVLISCL